MIHQLRRASGGEILSYTFLMDHLQKESHPRRTIGRMVEAGELLRVKKGLYVFGEEYRNGPIDRPLLANLLYGPSYVSGLYALAFYGFIPERVETVTSMTTERPKRFATPFGLFEYLHLSQQRYLVGVDWHPVGERDHALFASPEKALADVIARERDLATFDQLRTYLIESLRVDEEAIARLDLARMAKIAALYKSPVVRLLSQTLSRGI